MLKKAKSFREKLKRNPLNRNVNTRSTALSKHFLAQPGKRANGSKGNKLDEPDCVLPVSDSSARINGAVNPVTAKHPFVERIETKQKVVQQSIKFINYAILNRKTVILPGSATVTLETTFELCTAISTLISQVGPHGESELNGYLIEAYRQLASLISWADHVMLLETTTRQDSDAEMKPIDPLDLSRAKMVMEQLEESVDRLVDFACAKVKLYQLPSPVQEPNMMTLPKSRSKRPVDGVKRSSLPEVPLTPREQTILRETSLGAFDNPMALRQDSTPSESGGPDQGSIQSDDSDEAPPPKPYLPPNFSLKRAMSRSASADNTSTPPHRYSAGTPDYGRSTPPHRLSGSLLDPGRSTPPQTVFSRPNSQTMVPLIRAPLTPQYTQPTSPIEPINHMSVRQQHPIDIDELSQRMHRVMGVEGVAERPPALPIKRRPRIGSDYDNIHDSVDGPHLAVTPTSRLSSPGWSGNQLTPTHHQQASRRIMEENMAAMRSLSNSQFINSNPNLREQALSNQSSVAGSISRLSANQISDYFLQEQPPPLPPKQKQIESYMQAFANGETGDNGGVYSPASIPAEYLQTSRQFYLGLQEQHQRDLFLPGNGSNGIFHTGYPQFPNETPTMSQSNSRDDLEDTKSFDSTHRNSAAYSQDSLSCGGVSHSTTHNSSNNVDMECDSNRSSGDYTEISPLDDIDVRDQLIRTPDAPDKPLPGSNASSKRNSRSLPDLKGGSVDALIVYATHVGKHDFMYQEAFLTTYRTFVSSEDLINKLLYRYRKFANSTSRHHDDLSKKRLSRNAFSLLVRVIDELTSSELKPEISRLLLGLVVELVSRGELTLAKIMRKKILEKCDPAQKPVESLQIVAPRSPTRLTTLLDFKAQRIAEQMTLLNNDFYQKLELPELLTWSEEQNEEKCPNLVKFTENFNKISTWCKCLILQPEDGAVREKYFIKLVHTLKHLRRHNNFHSILAVLSALDSAPISRLDWPKQEKDIVQEYTDLTDSSGNFKHYRLALAKAEPPCIPYLGMILTDMTFIRIGNKPLLPDGNVNFHMRWNLFNVLECLRRFRKPAYSFKKDPVLLGFLENFATEVELDDNELWTRSKEIKPTNVK